MPPTNIHSDRSIATRESRRLSTLFDISRSLSSMLNVRTAMHGVLSVLASRHGVVRGIVVLQRDADLVIEAAEGEPDGGDHCASKPGSA